MHYLYFPTLDKKYYFSDLQYNEMFDSATSGEPNADAKLMLQHLKDGHEDDMGIVHLLVACAVKHYELWGDEGGV